MLPRSPRCSDLRVVIAGVGLSALGVALAVGHAPEDRGLSASDLEVPVTASVLSSLDADATGALLVDFVEPEEGEGGSDEAIAARVAALGVDVEPAGFYSEGEHLYRVSGDPASLAALAATLEDDPLVEGVEAELVYSLVEPSVVPPSAAGEPTEDVEPAKRPRFEPNDEKFGLQWHMEMIHAPEAWAFERGQGVVIAIVDTGVAWKDAPGFRQVPDLAGTRFVAGESFVSGAPGEGLDDHLHGTHVAGTVAQTTNNHIGVTGVAFESTLMPLKVLSREGRGSVADIANAIRYAADHDAQVLNMSLGGPLPSRVLSKAIEYANGKGVTVVCAAGNSSKSKVGYPAANKGAIAVSAVDVTGTKTWYSNWGKHLDIAAPGGDTRADRNGDGYPDGVLQNTIALQDPMHNEYMWLMGTSMASPHVAGVAGLVVGQGVTNPDEVERILKATAVHPAGVEWDEEYGAGVVDAAAAVAAAKQDYAPERAGLGGFLALGALAGLGGVAATRRRRLISVAGALAGFGVGAGMCVTAPLSLGIADALGGGAAFGSPILLSAALPLVLVVMLLGFKPLRSALAGLSLGYAAFLLHGALVLPTLVSGLAGGPCVDRLWLAINALVALWLARRVFKLDRAS